MGSESVGFKVLGLWVWGSGSRLQVLQERDVKLWNRAFGVYCIACIWEL